MLTSFSLLTRNKYAPSALILGVLLLACSTSYAQLQIPNPLLKPVDSVKTAVPTNLPPPPPPGRQVSSSEPSTAGSVAGSSDMKELREFFTGYYVSTIVGDQAVLRRAAGHATSAAGTASQPQASGANEPYSFVRSERMVLTSGSEITGFNATLSLVANVTDNAVRIVLHRDGKAKPGIIVFSGVIEASPSQAVTSIVLERPDSTYTQTLIQAKSSTGSAGKASAPTPVIQ